MGKYIALALVALLTTSTAHAYTFGVVPQQAASTLARLWEPLIERLAERTGMSLRFATAPDIPSFERRLRNGEYDFAYMNPYHYVVFHQAPGYQALARAKHRHLQGILVVRKDSAVQGIAELAGATLAFPAPAAFAASILTQAEFARRGISFTPKYVNSHDSVYRAVAQGLYPAGGGVVRTFETIAPEVRDQLRVLWRTREYTPHAIAVHPRVDPSLTRALRDALLALGQADGEGELLEALGMEGFEAGADADWNDVRALDLHLLDHLLAE